MRYPGLVSGALLLFISTPDAAPRFPAPASLELFDLGSAALIKSADPQIMNLPVIQREGPIGASIQIDIDPAIEAVRFAVFRQVPRGISFSHGIAVSENWIMSQKDFAIATVTNAGIDPEPMILEVLFFRESKQPPVARSILVVNFTDTTTLNTEAKTAIQKVEELPAGAIIAPPEEVKATIPDAISAVHENRDLEQARTLLNSGDISSARQILEFMAARGSAKGARALGETYDPAYLKNVLIAGLKPDPALAQKWYSRAVELGDSESKERLSAFAR